jgi:hypothetical protein
MKSARRRIMMLAGIMISVWDCDLSMWIWSKHVIKASVCDRDLSVRSWSQLGFIISEQNSDICEGSRSQSGIMISAWDSIIVWDHDLSQWSWSYLRIIISMGSWFHGLTVIWGSSLTTTVLICEQYIGSFLCVFLFKMVLLQLTSVN